MSSSFYQNELPNGSHISVHKNHNHLRYIVFQPSQMIQTEIFCSKRIALALLRIAADIKHGLEFDRTDSSGLTD